MNSLAYLSRQFDGLASARTPPTTPSREHPPSRFPPDPPNAPQRTWSFLLPSYSRSSPRPGPKRSQTSPSFQVYPSPAAPSSSSATASISTPLASASTSTASTSTSTQPPAPHEPLPLPQRSKSRHRLDAVINHVFFIRLFLLVWNNLNSAWSGFIEQLNLRVWARRRPSPISSFLMGKGKGKEAEVVEEVALTPSLPCDDSNLESQPPSRASTSSPEGTPAPPTRASTPVTHGRKAHFGQKTLVLDLDETLIHSTSRPMPLLGSNGSGFFGLGSLGRGNRSPGHTVEVILGGKRTQYHVYKRPFVDFFLRTVSGWYTLVIFTASMQEYADPVIDWLDAGRGILVQRFFRDSCTQLPNGTYTKDLSIIEGDLSKVCLVDNSPISYRVNEANGIPIEGWTNDPSDEALLDLLPVLDSLRFTKDVRHILGLRTAGLHRDKHSSSL